MLFHMILDVFIMLLKEYVNECVLTIWLCHKFKTKRIISVEWFSCLWMCT